MGLFMALFLYVVLKAIDTILRCHYIKCSSNHRRVSVLSAVISTTCDEWLAH